MKLTRWCGTITVAAILLGLAVTPGPASAENADEGPIAKVLFIQFPRDATVSTDGASGDLNVNGTGVLCSDYSYNGIHWANPNGIDYSINPASSGLATSTTVSSVRAALDTWDSACSPLSFSYQGTTGLGAGVQDYSNVVSWGDLSAYPGTIALTTTWYYTYSKHIVEVDTEMSISLAWSYAPPNVTHDLSGVAAPDESRYSDPTNLGVAGKYDIQDIMTHEAGHWLLLRDLYNDTQSELTMYGYGTMGELKKDTLSYGDELGVEAIYPMIEVSLNTSGLVSSYPATVHYWQGAVSKTATTYGTWSDNVDYNSTVSIDSAVGVSPTERYGTNATTSWTATETATYTVPYYHQFKPAASAVAAGPGHADLDSANHAALTYSQYGSGGVYSVFDSHGFNDWADAGSTLTLSSLSSGSNSTHRWYCPGTTSWVVNDAGSLSATYWDQFKPAISAATAGQDHSDLDATNYVTLTYSQCGAVGTFNVFDGQGFNDWMDTGSTVGLSNPSSASTATHRWYCPDTTSWNVTEAGSLSATYWNQFKPAISVATAGQGHTDLDATNHVTLTCSQYGAVGTFNVFDGQGFDDWVDTGSTASLSNPSSGSTSTHRWYCSETTSWAVNDASVLSATYWDQFKPAISVVTAGTGHTDLNNTNCATLTYSRSGTAGTFSVFDGQGFNDWVDIGSIAALSSTSSASTSTHSWYALGTTSWAISDAKARSATYWEEYEVRIAGITGLTSSRPTAITFTTHGATTSLTTFDTWTDWADAGSTLSVTKSVEGGWIGDWSTKDTTDWTVDSPISASIRYHRSYVGLYVLIGGLLVGATVIGAGIFLLLRIRRKGYALGDLPDYLSDRLDL